MRLVVGLLTALVLVIAAWARSTRWRMVFAEGHVIPPDADSAYHLRRMLEMLADPPRDRLFDASINWPEGAFCPWPFGFDELGVFWARLFAGDGLAPAAWIAVLPIVLGVLTTLVVMRMAREVVDDEDWATPIAAGLVFSVHPQSVSTAQLGRVDHHVGEVFVLALLAYVVVLAARGRIGRWAFELLTGVLVFGAVEIFAGSVIYVAILAGVLIARALSASSAGRLRERWLGSGALGLVVAAAALALDFLPLAEERGERFSFLFPSLLQPLLIVAAGCAVLLALGTAALVSPRGSPATTLLVRASGMGLVLALIALSVIAALPSLRAQLGGGLGWLAKDDPWLSEIAEFLPLYGPGPLFAWQSAAEVYKYYAGFGVLMPIIVPAGLVSVWRRGPEGRVFAGVAVCLFLLTMLQMRFGRAFAPLFAVLCACALRSLLALLMRGDGRRAAVSVGSLALLSTTIVVDPILRTRITKLADAEIPSIVRAALFLRDHPAAEEPGVLTRWDSGNFFSYFARRPIVASGFGHYAGAEGFYSTSALWRGEAEAAYRLMEARRLGVFVGGALQYLDYVRMNDGGGPFVSTDDGAVLSLPYLQAFPLSASIIGGSGLAAHGVPHLARLRPIYATPARVSGLSQPIPDAWLFDRVEGARITGTARPGVRIVLRTWVRVPNHSAPYEAWTDAGPDGRFEVVVPIASSEWSIDRGDGGRASLSVSEAQVLAGAEVRIDG